MEKSILNIKEIDTQKLENFKKYCKLSGKTMNAVIRDWIESFPDYEEITESQKIMNEMNFFKKIISDFSSLEEARKVGQDLEFSIEEQKKITDRINKLDELLEIQNPGFKKLIEFDSARASFYRSYYLCINKDSLRKCYEEFPDEL